MQFKEFLEIQRKKIDTSLYAFIQDAKTIKCHILKEAMAYTLCAKSKRLRPLLFLLVTDALGFKEDALPFACSLEMLHTYSLIHDDLPCMDNDDIRRGQPSCHKVYGEDIALLAGNALLNEALYLLSLYLKKYNFSADKISVVLAEIFLTTGNLLCGQALDLKDVSVTSKSLEEIYLYKTGCLFIFAVRLGCYICVANNKQVDLLTEFASKLGFMFQIQDDLLNIEGNAALLGKSVGSDFRKGKKTYPQLVGIEKATEKVMFLATKAKVLLRKCDFDTLKLEEFVDFLLTRKS